MKWSTSLWCLLLLANAAHAQEGSLKRLERTKPASSAGTGTGTVRGGGGPAERGGPPPSQGNNINHDDRVKVAREPKARAFALFGNCTATHLGRGVFLTAGHCVDGQIGLEGFRSTPCPYPLAIENLSKTVACNVITYRFDKTTDYALLEMTNPEEAATLPAFPVDYGMDWRKWGTRTVQLYGFSEQVLRANQKCTAKIEATRDRILHDCDTQGGDSGSALIDDISQHIIGVHAGGLRDSVNYAYPVSQIPWAESLCVAVSALERQTLENNGPPAMLRISTSHLSFQRMFILLNGSFAKNRVRVRLLAPEADIEVDPAWFKWSSATRFKLQELFVLDQHRAGPWAIEVSGFGSAKSKLKGYVDGRVWVCP